jgi:hypothetical protein
VPTWYLHFKATATPVLGTAAKMAHVAGAAGLIDVSVYEGPVDVGVSEPEQLVDYRFGQAQFSAWIERIGPEATIAARRRAIDAVRPAMRPYQIVVFLCARRPDG